MKKTTIIICMLFAAVLLLMTGCTAQTEDKITTYSDLDGKIIAKHSIPMPIEVIKTEMEATNSITIEEFLFFDTTAAAVAALKSNKVDAVCLPPFAAEFYVRRDSDLKMILDAAPDARFGMRMALRAVDTELLDMVNAAIDAMKADGTLDSFERDYISNLTDDSLLEGADIPIIPDAPTFYVGISGDLPPLDYIAANGKPGGYNVAVLSEISARAGINFEIVSMATDAKFTALLAGRIDLFFFHPVANDLPGLVELKAVNPDISFSELYYISDGFAFLVRK